MMTPLELGILLGVIGYIGIFFVHLLIRTPKLEEQLRNYYYGIAFFLIMFMICRVLFLINDIIYFNTGDINQKQGSFYIAGSFVAALAALGIMLVVEKFIFGKRLGFIPSIIILISASLILILPKINEINMVTYYTTITSLTAVIIPFLYVNVGLKVTGKSRKKSLILALGLIIFYLANLFNMGLLKDAFPIFIFISPITLLIGLAIFHYGLLLYNIDV